MAVSLSPGNINNWELAWTQNLQAQPAYLPDSYYPIPQVVISPIIFDRRFLTVQCLSTTAKPHWQFAAWLTASTDIPGNSLRAAALPRIKLLLRIFNLIEIPPTLPTYQIKLDIPYWIDQISFNVWQYVGPENDSIRSQLDRIEALL